MTPALVETLYVCFFSQFCIHTVPKLNILSNSQIRCFRYNRYILTETMDELGLRPLYFVNTQSATRLF